MKPIPYFKKLSVELKVERWKEKLLSFSKIRIDSLSIRLNRLIYLCAFNL
jgi:hypothetical protein